MKPVLVFDIETIPDVAGIRRINDWPAEVPDAGLQPRDAGPPAPAAAEPPPLPKAAPEPVAPAVPLGSTATTIRCISGNVSRR